MKKLPPNTLSKDIWMEIERIFWNQNVDCMPRGSAADGIDPDQIESTKRGVEIRGRIWFLQEGGNPDYDLNLCLSRPRFSSIESVTLDKLRKSIITESSVEDGLLQVTIR